MARTQPLRRPKTSRLGWTARFAFIAALFPLMVPPGRPADATGAFWVPDPQSDVYRVDALAAGKDVVIGPDATVVGSVYANGKVNVTVRTSVQGDASAVRTVKVRGTVSGIVTQGAPPLTLPSLPTEAEARALATRVVESNLDVTDTVVDDILFVHGNVRVRGALRGSGTIIATGKIKLDEAATAAAPDPATQLALVALRDVSVGKLRPFRGVIVSGGTVLLKGGNAVDGVAIGYKSVKVKRAGSFTRQYPSGDSTPPVVTISAPVLGSVLDTSTLAVTATLSDDDAVDPASVVVHVDGVDVTASAQITATTVMLTTSDLADGGHVVRIDASDRSGNPGFDMSGFTVDHGPPTVAIDAPQGTIVSSSGSVQAAIRFADTVSQVPAATVQVTLDGANASTGCTIGSESAQCTIPAVSTGSHTLAVTVRDAAGNSATTTSSFDFVLDTAPPTIAVTTPTDGLSVRSAAIELRGIVTDDAGIAALTLNGTPLPQTGGAFDANVPLAPGANTLALAATDVSGRTASTSIVVVRDEDGPVLTVDHPADGALSNVAQAIVTGSVRDQSGVVVTVNQAPVLLGPDGGFSTTVTLSEGANPIAITATDAAGNVTAQSPTITYFPLSTVTITSPADLAFIAATSVAVAGTVGDPTATVAVNGIPATVANGAFSASVPLIEGGNLLTAVATDAHGHASSATVNIVRDLTPPHLSIDLPIAGSTVYEPTVLVSGLVNDIVAGTVNASEATVTVNGVVASVANRSFAATIPLMIGDNLIEVNATDVSGNVGSAASFVHRADPHVARLAVLSGDGQAGTIGTTLPNPLVVTAVDGAGQPVAGVPVLFQVQQSSGHLDGGKRQLSITTDGNGRAQVSFTLGMRAGVANQRVAASAVGYAGSPTFSANALPGPATHVVADSGTLQFGVAGHALPRPLVAVVTDDGFNRLSAVSVRYAVTAGAGTMGNGGAEQIVTTDSDGRAIATLVLDPSEGNPSTVAEARIDGLDAGPRAAFVGAGLAASDPAATSISGVVLDNSNEPIAGVTLRIKDYPHVAQTDDNGFFRITSAPVGTIYLIVDGSSAARPGAWPDLEFVVTTIPGRDTTLGMPIYLLPLDLGHGAMIDETHGGRVTLADVPGFALDVEAGSVTFPGGSKTGVVSATVVHGDKVPMVPNFGQQPRFIVTIQPAGARIDPPARLTLPNVEGLAPGEVTEFYSFDHDLGHFVSIGPATVSEDGLVVTSNPGVGIVKAGWHCGGNPSTAGATHECGECQACNGSTCVPDDTNNHEPQFPDDCIVLACHNGHIRADNADYEKPPEKAPDDCKHEVCRNGFKTSIDAYDETPPQIHGNCQLEICPQPGEKDWLPDNSDVDPPYQCCPSTDPDVPPQKYVPHADGLTDQCCDAGQILPKYPTDTDKCHHRQPHPDYEIDYDGCSLPYPVGELGTEGLDKDNPAGGIDTQFSNFGSPSLPLDRPCDVHDRCFQTCSPSPDEDFSRSFECTSNFCVDMLHVCENSRDPDLLKRDSCVKYATIYCDVVQAVGYWSAYIPDQRKACDCC